MNDQVIIAGPPPGTCNVNPSTGAATCTPVDNSPDGISGFINDQVEGNVDDYVEHTSGLNWRIANHGPAMSPEQLEEAVEQFTASQGSEWSGELEALQGQVSDDGRALLQRLGSAEVGGLSRAEREQILEMILDDDNPQARIAILTALSDPGAVSATTLDAAMEFFAGVDLAAHSPELASALGQARLQHVGEQIQAVDPADPATVEAAQAAVESLRGSGYAQMLGIDGAQFGQVLDALLETIPVEGMSAGEVEAALEAFADSADALDASAGEPVATGLRLLAMQGGAIGLETSADGMFPLDPIDAVEHLADKVRMGNSATRFLVEKGLVPADSAVATTLGNPALKAVLGRIAVVLDGVQLLREVHEGDYAQAGFTGIGLAGVAIGTFGTASWAGPVGIALGVIAFGGSVGLSQWRNVQASNQYMDGESAAFLAHAGFAPDVAQALSDQSGKGISPVPFLFAYGEAMGLDREQTVAWLNGLDPGQLDSIRDRAHYALDQVDGDISKLDGPGDPDLLEFLSEYEEAKTGGYGYDSGNVFSMGDGVVRSVVAGSWEEFTAILQAKGFATPAPPLQGPGVAAVDLPGSAQVLLDNFDVVADGDKYITVAHLRQVRDDPAASLELRMAAEFVLGSRAARSYLDVGQGKGSVDGNISRADLEGAVDGLASGDYLDDLLDTASGRGKRDGNISEQDLASALVDPALTAGQREAAAEMQPG